MKRKHSARLKHENRTETLKYLSDAESKVLMALRLLVVIQWREIRVPKSSALISYWAPFIGDTNVAEPLNQLIYKGLAYHAQRSRKEKPVVKAFD